MRAARLMARGEPGDDTARILLLSPSRDQSTASRLDEDVNVADGAGRLGRCWTALDDHFDDFGTGRCRSATACMAHGAGRGPGHRVEPAAALTLRRSVGAVIGDAPLADGLRALLRLDIGIHVGLFGLLEIGQLEELTYYVILFGFRGPGERYVKWQKDRLSLEEAIGHFLRLRHAHEFGFDYEVADGGRDRGTG